MTLEQTMMWKHGSFTDYEKLIKKQEKLYKKIQKINDDIDWENDILELFNPFDEDERLKWENHNNKINNLYDIREKLLERIKENNERLQKEFY